MGQGRGISRGLIIASRLQGWDPTKIEGGGSLTTDIEPKIFTDQGGVKGTPPGDGLPESGSQGVDWQVGLGGKPTPSTKTSGADPFPGKPGAG